MAHRLVGHAQARERFPVSRECESCIFGRFTTYLRARFGSVNLRHLVVYRVAPDGVTEVLSLLHDRMLLPGAARRARSEADC